jgi:starch phosphorylase
MRESMAQLTPCFSASRTVREYTEQHYLPAAAAFAKRAANNGAVGRQMVDWQRAIERSWGLLRFGEVRVDTSAERHIFEVELFLGDLDPDAVRVEIYAEGIGGGDPVREKMNCVQLVPDASQPRVYQASVSATRPAGDYTARVVPCRLGVATPLELTRILWQR